MDYPIEVIARGVLLRESFVLLCQNVRHGYWYLPGGHVDFNEPAAKAVVREFHEECGLAVRPGPCVLITEGSFTAKRPHHEVNLVFPVEEVGDPGDVSSREPGIAFGWFELAQLQEVDLRPAGIKAWLLSGGRSPESGGCQWVSEMSQA
jgi:8-oxo-dGTP diphosphatase